MAESNMSIYHVDSKFIDSSSDLSYLLEVLNINDGQTEDQLDERLRCEAKKLGVDIERDATSKAKSNSVSTSSSSESSRRPQSTFSRASHSTSLTSICSGESQDEAKRRPHRQSLSLRDYDAFLARGMPMGNTSWSFSPSSPSAISTFSLPLSQPSQREPARKKSLRRVLGRLKTSLNGSAADLHGTCPHCPLDGPSQRKAIHRLPCGHRLCEDGLRNTINDALSEGLGAVPSCCRIPIPGRLVEQVMTGEEQDTLLEKLNQWDEAISQTALPNWPQSASAPTLPPLPTISPLTRTPPTPTTPTTPQSLPSPEYRIPPSPSLSRLSSREDYRALTQTQSAQQTRLDDWISTRRSALVSSHDFLRSSLHSAHESMLEDLADQHLSAVTEAEDKHVQAESELLETQARSLRDASIALRHKEAFCRGVYSDGLTPHHRPVGAREREELLRARRDMESTGLRHANAVNVLRGEQARRMRLRLQRQDKELQELRRGLRKEELEVERACNAEMAAFEEEAGAREGRVRWRWEIERAILVAKIGIEEERIRRAGRVGRLVEAQGYAAGFMIRG